MTPATASPRRLRRPLTAGAALALALGLVAAACGSSGRSATASGGTTAAPTPTVKVVLTSKGCQPTPTSVTAGPIEFDVSNKDADAVSEAELRSHDGAHILGEQENLSPGLSGGFTVTLQKGSYLLRCPGAKQADWKLAVSGASTKAGWESDPQLAAAVSGYNTYVNQNVAGLVTATQAFCAAIDAGDLNQAQLLYSPARLSYERIEPVAEIWGDLDAQIDGRWENPITVASQFIGFHRIEQLLFQDKTVAGAAPLCAELVTHEQQLQTLVSSGQYSPLEMAAGATDLINEAADAKISGEEERYSNVDLPTFRANVDGAQEVVTLLTPYLQAHSPATLALINQRYQAVLTALAPYQATPGYLNTGYVDYSTVTTAQRKSLSGSVNAYAEALSKLSEQVS
jgi:iron uptake system component EfeO